LTYLQSDLIVCGPIVFGKALGPRPWRNYRGVNKSLRWSAVEDLRIHRIHLFITQEEVTNCANIQLFACLSRSIFVHLQLMAMYV
jgi:hypothetical protein